MTVDPDALAELDAAAEPEYPAEPGEHVRQAWKIENDEQAAWALRLLAENLAAVEETAAAADERRAPLVEALARVDGWFDRTTSEARRTIDFCNAVLERYGLDERARTDEQRKSIDTPDGKVETRAGRESLDVTDDSALLRWVRATKQRITDWAKPEYKPRKDEIKAKAREAVAVRAAVLEGVDLPDDVMADNPTGTPIIYGIEDPARPGVLVFCPTVVARPDQMPPYPEGQAVSNVADLVDVATGETMDPDAGVALPVGTLVVADPTEDPAEHEADQTWLVVPGVELRRGAVTATAKPAVLPPS